jgi:hypothetical protein
MLGFYFAFRNFFRSIFLSLIPQIRKDFIKETKKFKGIAGKKGLTMKREEDVKFNLL